MIANSSIKGSGCGCGGGTALSVTQCSCGGTGCAHCQGQGIVRPRFFAGQLLTEDDLQLLTNYVGQKNRLHNRHLFGAGVVCGLDVTCHPCADGRVIVNPGYALDCCGNDLTLACPQTLDINGMIRDLRRDQLGGYDCGDPCSRPKHENDEHEDADKLKSVDPYKYCLYLRYCEQSSDPVMPYSTGDDCGQPGCEPTRVREGVKFELRCRPLDDATNPLIQRLCGCVGDLDRLERIIKALDDLNDRAEIALSAQTLTPQEFGSEQVIELNSSVGKLESLIPVKEVEIQRPVFTERPLNLAERFSPETKAEIARAALLINRFEALPMIAREDFRKKSGQQFADNLRKGRVALVQAVHSTAQASVIPATEVRNWLLDRLKNSPFITDCTLRQTVRELSIPDVKQQNDDFREQAKLLVDVLAPLREAVINFLRECVCRALNPQCTPCEDSAILLACLEVQNCQVIRICNMERTFVLSPAAVRYWLPPLQLAGNLVERFCCNPVQSLLPIDPKGGTKKFDIGALLFEEIVRMLRDSLCRVSDEQLRGLSEWFSRIFHSDRSKVPSRLSSGQSRPLTADAAESASVSARKGTMAGKKTAGTKKPQKESNVKKAIQAGKIGEAPPPERVKTTSPAEAVKTEPTPASAPKGEEK